jgi:hypothetical protein
VAATDRTFAGAGKVALWTKADSVTRFGRLETQARQWRPGLIIIACRGEKHDCKSNEGRRVDGNAADGGAGCR